MNNLDDIKVALGAIAAVLAFVAYAPYLRDIIKGKTKPHIYSWFIWGLTAAIIFPIQLGDGAGAGAWSTAIVAIMCFLVCILGFRQGTKYIRPVDTLFLVMALMATAFWLVADRPLTSMILLCTIDVLAMVPTIRKGWGKPGQETLSMWTLNGLRRVLAILALQHYSLITLMSPVLWLVANIAFSMMLIDRRRTIRTKRRLLRKRRIATI